MSLETILKQEIDSYALQAIDLSTHVSAECKKRSVSCADGCGKNYAAEGEEEHRKHQCFKRNVPCGLVSSTGSISL